MDDFAETAAFLEQAARHVLGERWEPFVPGMSATYRHDEVGIYVHYSEEYISWKATVQAAVPVAEQLLGTLAEINEQLPIGQLTLSSGVVLWRYKILPHWLDVHSRSSAALLLDVLQNAPQMVDMSRERLAPHGGVPYTPEDLNTLMFM